MVKKSGIYGLHIVRYGTAADQRYFLDDFSKTFDQLVVNANMVAHMPAAISSFVSQAVNKPYFIDPQTHVFQQDIENLLSKSKASKGKVKRSWNRLIEWYGEPLSSLFLKNVPTSLLPEDLYDSKCRKEFTKRVMLFQQEEITYQLLAGSDAEYLKFLAKESGESGVNFAPSLLVAPYFFLGDVEYKQWLSLNLDCIKDALDLKKKGVVNRPIAAQIVITSNFLLDDKLQSELIRKYSAKAKGVDYILLWIDKFSEHQASVEELQGFVGLIDKLASEVSPVVNLYGGFFSIAQARVGALKGKLIGVCHGLEYGETKPVIPLSGGVPVARFYSKNLHHRLPSRQALSEITELNATADKKSFHQKICDCKECRKVITDNVPDSILQYTETKPSSFFRSGRWVSMDFPTADASDHCTQHYLWRKKSEYTGNLELSRLIKRLKRAYEKLRKPVGLDHAGHAMKWAQVLDESNDKKD